MSNVRICEWCGKRKEDVRYADLVGKWICSDCMGVEKYSKVD